MLMAVYGPSFSGMPIREGSVNEKREVLFQTPPDNFVIGDETMIERRFESSDVIETVLRDAQPIKGTISFDTPELAAARPQISEAYLTEPCEIQFSQEAFRC